MRTVARQSGAHECAPYGMLMRGGWSVSAYMRDRKLRKQLEREGIPEIIWTEPEAKTPKTTFRAAE